jgi:hypothetical protein
MAFKMKGFAYPGKSPLKKVPYYKISDDGTRTEIGFEEFKQRANRLENVEATGQERVDLWKARLMGGKTGVDEIDATPKHSAQTEYSRALEANKPVTGPKKKKKKRNKKNIFGNIKGTKHIKGR